MRRLTRGTVNSNSLNLEQGSKILPFGVNVPNEQSYEYLFSTHEYKRCQAHPIALQIEAIDFVQGIMVISEKNVIFRETGREEATKPNCKGSRRKSVDIVGRLLKETTKGNGGDTGWRGEDKFASIWRRSECQTRVIVSAHFICILINSTRNGIVAQPSLWHSPYRPPRIFLVFPPTASLLSRSYVARSYPYARLYVQPFAVYICFSVLVSFTTLIYGSCF